MLLVTNIIFIIALVIAAVLGLWFFTHMLQLSSYQYQGYSRLLSSFRTKFTSHIGVFVGVLGAGYYMTLGQDPKLGMSLTIFSIMFLAVMAYTYFPRPAKKKFVVTARVKRLFATYGILTLLLIFVSFLIYRAVGLSFFHYFIWGVYISMMPMIPALANLINKPVEKAVANYYINDAKKMLENHGNLRIIGITGSYGKTSVKYFLTTLLSENFRVLMTPESYNTPMGIVKTIREHLMPTHEIFVCEMGARHLHDIKEITDIVHPDDGIITSIGSQHLETFRSMENIISTKYELLDAVEEKMQQKGKEPGKNLKFVNADCDVIRENMKYPDAITYGVSEGCDYRASDITASGAGLSFTVTAPSGEKEEFSTKLLGSHNVENIVGAIAVANSLGIPLARLKGAVRHLQGVPHRLELSRHGNVTIIDDAYNSNPSGAAMAVETLSLFKDSVKILVTPGMVELGATEEKYNKEFGKQAAQVCDYIITVGDKNSEAIKKGAKSAGFDPERIFNRHTFNEASALMYELDAGREKVILLENDLPDNYK